MVQQVWPERGRPVSAVGAVVWRQRAPLASFQRRLAGSGQRLAGWRQRPVGWRQRLAGWRVRNWRRVVLAWFVVSLIVMAVAAEPTTDFPKAQARSVPAVRMVMRVGGGLTAAGVPLLLIALP